VAQVVVEVLERVMVMNKQEARKIAAKAIWIFAVWKDGIEYVGSTGKTLFQAQAEILNGDCDEMLGIQNLPEGE
jgi:hypothetical protein